VVLERASTASPILETTFKIVSSATEESWEGICGCFAGSVFAIKRFEVNNRVKHNKKDQPAKSEPTDDNNIITHQYNYPILF
jgi:hypothetical protein